ATLQRVSCWITGSFLRALPLRSPSAPSLPRPLNDLDDAPALRLAERTGLHHADRVTEVRVVVLVVRRELVRARDRLLVERVPDLAIDADEDGLVHLVRHDHADA